MNPSIHSTLQEIKQYETLDRQGHLSSLTARLQVLLAEEAEAQSNKISEQTDSLIKLTKAIVWFTVVLLFVGIIQIIMIVTKS